MRAAFYRRNGPARDVLEVSEAETPQPAAGEVRIRLAVSGVNPSDVKARNGSRPVMLPFVIPHSDGAGVIDAVGEGVARDRVGQRVWTWNGQWKRPFGTCAQYIVLPAEQAVPLPDGVSFDVGACLGIPALTAWHAVAVAGLADGMSVLISGGAGAVAQYAIQFARARGAHVLTTVSSPSKAELATRAGAQHVIDYQREDVGERVKAIVPSGVDAVIELDIAANARHLPQVLRPKGTVVIYGTGAPEAVLPASFCLVNAISLKFIFIYEISTQERTAAIADIDRWLREDRLVHTVAAAFPLDDIVAAHEAVEQRKFAGNVIVRLP